MIGVYGGTFDPVHYGHLRTAIEVKEIFSLQQIHLIPCHQPAHRAEPDCTAEMRCEMLQLAVKSHCGLVVDKREIERSGVSYMVDTLASVSEDFPGQQVILFIGSDAFNGLMSWYQWQRLFDYAHVVVMMRPGHTTPELDGVLADRHVQSREQLLNKQSGYLYFLQVTQLEISATAIRRCFKQGLNPAFLLPESVIEYITAHEIYL